MDFFAFGGFGVEVKNFLDMGEDDFLVVGEFGEGVAVGGEFGFEGGDARREFGLFFRHQNTPEFLEREVPMVASRKCFSFWAGPNISQACSKVINSLMGW